MLKGCGWVVMYARWVCTCVGLHMVTLCPAWSPVVISFSNINLQFHVFFIFSLFEMLIKILTAPPIY